MEKQLKSIGLSDREIKVYLSLLKLGSSKVGDIVKKSDIPSSKIYEVLEKLKSKGLVSYILKGKIKYFQSSEPESLIELIDERKSSLQRIVPKLKEIQSSINKEEVTLFNGLEGMKTALRKVLNVIGSKEDYYVYIPPTENMDKESSVIFFNNFNLKRKQRGIKTKLLIHKNHKSIIREKYPTLKNQEVRFIDFSFPSRLGIYKDHVLIINENRDVTSILINSEDIFKDYRDFFLSIWSKGR